MKKTPGLLTDIVYKTGITKTSGSMEKDIYDVVSDSRSASKGCLFVAVKGLTVDGHDYIEEAINKGASAILCERIPDKVRENVSYIVVSETAKALGIAAANFYDHPSRKLKLIGVTGTNGKTTVTRMLYEVFKRLGHRCGLISTISNVVHERETASSLTTPDAITINNLLHQMVEEKCEYVFMEVSSHALAQSRVNGITFTGAIFTNFSHDHLDYHKSTKEYLNSKQMLFNDLEEDAFALTNLDDKNGLIMVQNTKADRKTYSLQAMADYKGRVLENSFSGLHLQIDDRDVWCNLVGKFNAYNVLTVYATGCIRGKNKENLLTAISASKAPEGRFELINGNDGIKGIVDYAHTPDALKNILETINEIRTGNEKLITVLGCGGDRDKTKRGPMAAIAASLSDKVIFTSDNPRSENPQKIINDMKKGLDLDPALKSKYLVVTNRKEAINVACVMATNSDIILVAGKGHEKFQEIKGVKHPFDDKQILHHLLNR